MDDCSYNLEESKSVPKNLLLYNSLPLCHYEKNPFSSQKAIHFRRKTLNESKTNKIIKAFTNQNELYKFIKEKSSDLVFDEENDNEADFKILDSNSLNLDNSSNLNKIPQNVNLRISENNYKNNSIHLQQQNMILNKEINTKKNMNKIPDMIIGSSKQIIDTPKINGLLLPEINVKDIELQKRLKLLKLYIRKNKSNPREKLFTKNKIFKLDLELNNKVIQNFEEVINLVSLENSFTSSQVTYNNSIYGKINLPSFPKVLSDKSLILDLDETLIHLMDRIGEPEILSYHSDILNLKLKSKDSFLTNSLKIIIRPFAREFFKEIAKYYEIIIYTSSEDEYAKKIVNEIIKDNNVPIRFYTRKYCIQKFSCLIKDIKIFSNRNIKNLVVLDNLLVNFYENIENGILVPDFYGESNDTFLKDILNDLIELSHCEDVRKELKARYNLTSLFNEFLQLNPNYNKIP